MSRFVPPFVTNEEGLFEDTFLTEETMGSIRNELVNALLRTARHAYDHAHGKPLHPLAESQFEAFKKRLLSVTEAGGEIDPTLAQMTYERIVHVMNKIPPSTLESYLEMAKKELTDDVDLYYNHKRECYDVCLPYRNIPYYTTEGGIPNFDEFYDALLAAFHDTRAYQIDAGINQDNYTRELKKFRTDYVHFQQACYHFDDEVDVLTYVNKLMPRGVSFGDDGHKKGCGLN